MTSADYASTASFNASREATDMNSHRPASESPCSFRGVTLDSSAPPSPKSGLRRLPQQRPSALRSNDFNPPSIPVAKTSDSSHKFDPFKFDSFASKSLDKDSSAVRTEESDFG